MEGNTTSQYEQQIKAILATSPTAADLNTQLQAFDAALAATRMKAVYENIVKTAPMSLADAALVEQAKGLL